MGIIGAVAFQNNVGRLDRRASQFYSKIMICKCAWHRRRMETAAKAKIVLFVCWSRIYSIPCPAYYVLFWLGRFGRIVWIQHFIPNRLRQNRNSASQTDMMTFAFSSVSILLLCCLRTAGQCWNKISRIYCHHKMHVFYLSRYLGYCILVYKVSKYKNILVQLL